VKTFPTTRNKTDFTHVNGFRVIFILGTGVEVEEDANQLVLGRFAEGLRFVKGAFHFVPVKRSFGVGLFFVLRDAHGQVVFLFDVRQAALANATSPTTLIHGDVLGHRENLRLLTYARLMFVLLPFLRAVALHHVVRFGVSQLKPGIRARRDVDRVGANGAGPNLGFLGPRVLFDLLSAFALGTGVRHGPTPSPEVSVCTAETLLCAQVSQNPVCATESILCAQVSRRPFFCQRPWCEQKGTKHGI